ncbi:MAG: hypothetical protein EA344_06200 [Alkalicoccus sp.]|nr:MAG: hypothetical protein EA344_06200 [Alkalicoccus sp.]
MQKTSLRPAVEEISSWRLRSAAGEKSSRHSKNNAEPLTEPTQKRTGKPLFMRFPVPAEM